MRTDLQIDAGFIRRVYRTSIIVWALVALMVHARWGWTAVIGLTTGTALALGSMRAIEWATRTVLNPGGSRNAGARVLAVGLLKLALIAVILAGEIVVAQRLQANLLALILGIAGGFFLVHLVILLKAVGLWLLSKGAAVTPADRPRIRR